MARIEDNEGIAKEREEAEKRNPLLKLGMGDLIGEMYRICLEDSNVLKPRDKVPESSFDNYRRYLGIKIELNRRGNYYGRDQTSFGNQVF